MTLYYVNMNTNMILIVNMNTNMILIVNMNTILPHPHIQRISVTRTVHVYAQNSIILGDELSVAA